MSENLRQQEQLLNDFNRCSVATSKCYDLDGNMEADW
ncbi:hypothetical protein T03_17435 [Trichinella britovi]|uniref:Uncharacterized protein n=1 Tax=Trichinella britovi TaxID=45882 RepID=A0A0V1AQY4_TRIBR|nr:hypothetical protein T03_17435 [Trichinella britovi]